MRQIINIFVLLLIFSSAFGQRSRKKADKAFDQLMYAEAIQLYQKHLEKNDDFEAKFNLAMAYRYNNQFSQAENTFLALHEKYPKHKESLFNLSELYLLNGKSTLAKAKIEQYIDFNGESYESLLILKSCNQAKSFSAQENLYKVSTTSFNSEVSDYAPVYFQDKILFTSQKSGDLDAWTGRSYSNLFLADANGNINLLKGDLKGKYHNGTACFDGEKKMYFTRNSQKKGKQQDYNLLIASAKLEGDKWNFESYFPFNNKDYNTAYPAISPDGQLMVFSSNRPGGKGGMDLYLSRKVNGRWTEPVNMSWLNTKRDEVFANIDPYGQLYFASNGRPGLGGLDIYKTVLNNQSAEITNLGKPINSNRDDFGLITNDQLKSGYFCSNRNNSNGTDDIYMLNRQKQNLILNGIVLDEYTRIPLKMTRVEIKNEQTGKMEYFMTDEDGRFSFDVQSESIYHLQGEKNGIKTSEENIQTLDYNPKKELYYTLLHNDPRFSLEGYALNVKDKKGVQFVEVHRFNTKNSEDLTEETDNQGFFKFQLEQNSNFEISGTKDGYFTSVSEATTVGLDRSTTLYVKLFLNIEEVVIGETKILGKETFGGWEFENIYYDLDKFNIRPDAAIALNKVVDFLKANPKLKIELGAHTDARASDNYNLTLSHQRAVSAVDYIVSNGISSQRIIAKGYGESRLVNHCADGVDCDEVLHQLNRRTEITVLAID